MTIIKNALLVFLLTAAFPALLTAQISQNMSLLGQWDDNTLPSNSFGDQYSDCWGYANATGEYAIMGSARYIHVFNVTNPANPIEVLRFDGGTNTAWREFRTYSHYLYAVTDATSEGLRIFDLSPLPAAPTQVYNSTAFFSRCHTIHVDSVAKRLYCAGTNTRSNGLIVLSLVNPAAPTQLASVALTPGGYVHDCYVRANKVYASHGNNGLHVWDFTTPTAPVHIGEMSTYVEEGYNHSSWMNVAGTHLVMTDETHGTGVKMVDVVSDPVEPFVTDTFRSTLKFPLTNSIGHNPCVRGDFVYMSYYHDGIQVWDISNPNNVERVGYYDTETASTSYSGYAGPWGVYPYLPSGTIVGSDMKNGLFLLQLSSNCRPPTGMSFLSLTANSVKVDWNTVPGATQYRMRYRAAGSGSAWTLVTISGNTNSFRNITNLYPGTTYEVQVASNCAYGWTTYAGIKTFTTPTTNPCPIPADQWVANVTPTTATLAWNRAPGTVIGYTLNYRRTGTATWKTVNLTDTFRLVTALTPNKTYEYRVATRCTSLKHSPFSTPETFTTPATNLAAEERGELPENTEASLLDVAIYPNPASEELHIEMPGAQPISGLQVEIFDLSGRMVHGGSFEEEGHLIFDLTDLPRGVYACRVRAGERVRVEQIVVAGF